MFISVLLIASSTWAINYFGNVNLNVIIFNLLVPMEGTSSEIIFKYIIDCIPITIIITGFIVFFANILITKNVFIKLKIYKLNFHISFGTEFKKVIVLIILIVFSVYYSLTTLNLKSFIISQTSNSDFIESNYVDPRDVEMTFPKQKRNLIYIYLESMEYTYEDMGIINELKELKNENVDFNTEHGAYTAGYTTWTMAAMLAQTAGIPLNLSFDGNSMSSFNTFFPGLYNLGNILEDNGYNNYFAIGSDAKFGGRKNYFEQHGNYQIWDLNSALENKYMSIKDVVFWGYDDSDLIKYAKMQLSDIDTKTPFNYTMLTVNTHHMDGWLEDDCETNYDTQYANVISCSSRQITEFVNWLKEQDFYNNTTIIISGDHTSMNKAFFENLDENYIRTTYVTVINPAIGYTKGNREYSTMDLFPTTLASLGVKIDGDRLGLGTNLFSSKYTLSEIYGKDNLDLELSKKSSFYDEKFSVPILKEK